jgi:hypothetical protein
MIFSSAGLLRTEKKPVIISYNLRMYIDFSGQPKLVDSERRYIQFLRSRGLRVDVALVGYFRWLVATAYAGMPSRESARARRLYFRCSGSALKQAREVLEWLGLLKVVSRGSFRSRLGTEVRPTPLFSRVTGV